MEISGGDTEVIVQYVDKNQDLILTKKSTQIERSKIVHSFLLKDLMLSNLSHQLSSVSVLNLTNCDICVLPKSIQNLVHLKALILAYNNFQEVPSCLYTGLKSLDLLDLSHNEIRNFDIEPACSLGIKQLYIHNNYIYNLPNWILVGRCWNLQELYYSHNKINDLDTTNRICVREVEMQNCQLIDTDFKFFKRLQHLELLDVGNDGPRDENQFRFIDHLFVRPQWENLQVLKLNNLIVSILCSQLFDITTLRELHVVNCQLSWIPSEIKNLACLEVLDISQNLICSLPSELYALDNLKVVKAASNHISTILCFKSELEVLDIYDNLLEKPPADWNRAKIIDMEYNYFDAPRFTMKCGLFMDYVSKFNQLRNKYEYFERTSGWKQPPSEANSRYVSSSEEESSSSEDDSSDSEESEDTDEESDLSDESRPQSYQESVENWDETECSAEGTAEKHPDAPASDEEWEDDKEARVETEPMTKGPGSYEYDEWLFCDAD